jgi:palmitoyltransferase
LITFGANVNYQEPTRAFTPLHFSINNQNPISFHVLLKHPNININLKNVDNYDPLSFARSRQNLDAVAMLESRIQSSKINIKPKFLQRYLTNEFIRKWLTRFFMLFVMTLIGLSFNAYEFPMLVRMVFPIVVIFILTHVFHYFVFDAYTKDNFAFSYVLSSSLLMYVTYVIYLQGTPWSLAHVCYHLFTFYGLYCVHCIKKYNPGFIKQQTMIIDGNSLTKEKICMAFARDSRWTLEHFCVTCLIRRPLRSKHCPMDATCVAKFDHHCSW